MQIYFHSHLCSYLSRVLILVEGTVRLIQTANVYIITRAEVERVQKYSTQVKVPLHY